MEAIIIAYACFAAIIIISSAIILPVMIHRIKQAITAHKDDIPVKL